MRFVMTEQRPGGATVQAIAPQRLPAIAFGR
jgi:hypothetical protein